MPNGGARPGAGRKPGKKNAATLEKEKVLAELRQRIMETAQRILDGQMFLVRGQQFLYQIEKEKIAGPKRGISYRSMKPVVVTAEWEIQAYLDGLVDEGGRSLAMTLRIRTLRESSSAAPIW